MRLARGAKTGELSIFQSTHPVRGATTVDDMAKHRTDISIHAPREGCDRGADIAATEPVYISIHAPREGCDLLFAPYDITRNKFQSTHPVRGATDLRSAYDS